MPEPRIELLTFDPQIDFMDLPGSQLPIIGATRNMARLAASSIAAANGWRHSCDP